MLTININKKIWLECDRIMKVGFSTLSLFMKSNNEIIEEANNHDFDMIEILLEDVLYHKDMTEYKNCNLELKVHAATVDINIASLNKGIRTESINQMIYCGEVAKNLGATSMTIHPGKIGRIDERIRKFALEIAIESIQEIIDNTSIDISVENMPNRKSFLATNVDEMEYIQHETDCLLTIDTGHANTTDNLEELLSLRNISYCHLHDNNGINDQHLPLGDGTLDLSLLEKIDNGIIELNNFQNVLKSKKIIEEYNLWKIILIINMINHHTIHIIWY